MLKLVKKALFIIGGLFVLLIGAALVVPSFVDWNQYKDQVRSTVHSLTGHDIEIGGNLSFRLIPSPQLSAADVSLANPEAWSSKYFLELESLNLDAAFLPLLSLNLQVNSITLQGARINLVRNAEGVGNWEALTGKKDDGGGRDLRFDYFHVENAVISYSDEATGFHESISDIDATLSAGSMRGPFQGEGLFSFRHERVGFQLALGELFEDRRSPFKTTLVLGGQEPGVKVSGSVLFEDGAPILSGQLEVSGGDLGRLLNAISRLIGGAPVGGLRFDQAFELESDIAFGGRRFLAERFDLRVGKTVGSGKLLIDLQEQIEGSTRFDINTIVVEDWLVEGLGEGGAGYSLLVPSRLAIGLEIEIGAIQYGNSLARQLTLKGRFDKSHLEVEDFGVLLPGGANLNFAGRVFGDGRKELLEGTLEFSADNLRATLDWVGVDLSLVPTGQLGTLKVRSRLRVSPEAIDLISASGRIDITNFDLSAALGLGARPYYAINGSIDRINLSSYMGPARPDEARVIEPRWPTLRASIEASLKPLAEFGADIKLKAEHVALGGDRMQNIDVDGQLRSGTLTVRNFSASGLKGLDVGASGVIGQVGDQPTYNLNIDINSQNLREFLQFADGTGELDADLLGRTRLSGSIAGDLNNMRLDLSAMGAGAEASIKGTITKLGPSPQSVDLSLHIEHPEHLDFLHRLGLISQPDSASMPLMLDLSAQGSGESLRLSGQFELIGGTGGISGSVADPFGSPEIDIFLTAGHPEFSKLVRGFGMKFNPSARSLGEFSLAAAVMGNQAELILAEIEAVIGPTRVTGDLRYEGSRVRPRLSGQLTADRLPLHDFMPKTTAGAEEATLAGGRRWSRNPLELGALKEMEADLTLGIGLLQYEAYAFTNAALSVKLESGILRIPDLQGKLLGGDVEISASLDANALPTFETSLALRRMDVDAVLAATAAMRPATGRLTLNGKFTARGNTQAEMISNLDGRAEVAATDGVIRGIDIDRLSERLGTLQTLPDFVSLLATALNGGETPYSSITTDVIAENGVLKMERLAGQISGATLDGEARVDLPNWNMGVTAEMKLVEPQDLPPIGVDVTGRVSRPKVEYRTSRIRNYMGLRLATTVFGLNPQPAPGGQPLDPEQGGAQTPPTPKSTSPEEEVAKSLFKLLEEVAKKKKKKDGS
jgi:uncharacterized protein involved in outer membrane biogenesis